MAGAANLQLVLLPLLARRVPLAILDLSDLTFLSSLVMEERFFPPLPGPLGRVCPDRRGAAGALRGVAGGLPDRTIRVLPHAGGRHGRDCSGGRGLGGSTQKIRCRFRPFLALTDYASHGPQKRGISAHVVERIVAAMDGTNHSAYGDRAPLRRKPTHLLLSIWRTARCDARVVATTTSDLINDIIAANNGTGHHDPATSRGCHQWLRFHLGVPIHQRRFAANHRQHHHHGHIWFRQHHSAQDRFRNAGVSPVGGDQRRLVDPSELDADGRPRAREWHGGGRRSHPQLGRADAEQRDCQHQRAQGARGINGTNGGNGYGAPCTWRRALPR